MEEFRTIEHGVQIGDVRYVVLKRVHLHPDGEEATRYSMDAGATFHATLSQAYVASRDSGSLIHMAPDGESNDESLEAFVVALVSILQSLEEGESVKVIRSGGAVMVTKECEVLHTRASTLGDVDLKLGEIG